jgi:Xaa-Pro aminopeptidase
MPYELRTSAIRRDTLTLRRLESLVPRLMAENEIDCWIVTSREYADDAVAMTMLPAEWFSSRRRSILVFLRFGDEVKRLSVARYDMAGFFEPSWNPDAEPDQWAALAAILNRHSPASIALNYSSDFAHADGITHSEYQALTAALTPELSSRITTADPLSVTWLETRLPEEREVMAEACGETHAMLRRALSDEAIEPGVTTTEDLGWWLRARVQDLGTYVWFHPTVSVQRSGPEGRGSFAAKPGDATIERGDLVHIDFGIVWDGLCTDQQEHGYVLRDGESDVPDWMTRALGVGNQMQDLLTGSFQVGQTGNEVLEAAQQRAAAEGIEGTVYTHPIGFHGHGAGATIGLWDNQDGIPGSGDRALRPDTAWSIELMVTVDSRDWDKEVNIMLEQNAWFDGEHVTYLDGRQTRIWVID